MTTGLNSEASLANTSESRSRPMRQALWLALILAGYLLVTSLYGAINPLFEAPDEHWHYFTAQYIADHGQLPAVASGDAFDPWLSQEAAQPPLYYMLGALFIAPIDTSAARDTVWPNKFASVGDASELINLNRFVHTSQEQWPWHGYVLAAHLLRMFSTLLGLGTLVCIYLAAHLLWPDDGLRALLATGLVAYLPQFNFLHASVSNDPLVIFLISAALWQLTRLWQRDVTAGRLLLLGVTIGLAALAKNAGITLLLYAAGFLILLALRNTGRMPRPTWSGWRLAAGSAALVVLPALLLVGWLWARNWSLYGDFTAANQFISIAGGERGYTPLQVLYETPGLWLSSFAVFGWFNIRAPQWVYWFWGGVVLLALAGGLWRAMRFWRIQRQAPPLAAKSQALEQRIATLLQQRWILPLLLGAWVFAIYASLLLFLLRTEAAQGRLLFPAILPAALGLAAGLTATRFLRRLSPILVVAAFPITLFCLFFVLRPVYELPHTVIDLPGDARLIDADMGQGLRLQAAQTPGEATLPGDAVELTLYWRGDNVAQAAPEFVLSAFGRDEEEIGKVHSYHGRGLYPAGLWLDGQTIADRFGFFIEESAIAPVLARLDATIINGHTATAGELKIVPAEWPPLVKETAAQLGDFIELITVQVSPARAQPGEALRIVVRWQVRGAPQTDYTTLVHLGQPDATPLATGDSPPLNGHYPTRVWENGEQFDDVYELRLPDDLPPGRYPVWIGMYDSKTQQRLPLTIAGEAQPHNVYLAGWVDVE